MPLPFRRLRKAAKAAGAALEPSHFVVRGELVVCPICKEDGFLHCLHILHFGRPPERAKVV